MEVGEKGVDDLEVVSGIDEEIGLSRAKQNIAGMSISSKLKGSDSGCADCDDAARFQARLPNLCSRDFRDGIDLGVEVVLFHLLRADRLERSQTDMEGDLGGVDSPGADARKNFGSEVEAGGGGRNRSALVSVDGLIAFAVGWRIFTGNVGRERNMSYLVNAREEIVDRIEPDAAFSERSASENLGAEFVALAEEQLFANVDLAAGTYQAFPFIGILLQLTSEENFDPSAKEVPGGGVTRAQALRLKTGAASVKTRRKNSGVVENQEIVGAEKIGEITKLPIVKYPHVGRKMQETRGRAVRQGLLRDQFGRQFVIEIGDEHAFRL